MGLFRKRPFSVAPKETLGQRIARKAKRIVGWVGPSYKGRTVELRQGPHPNPGVRVLTREEHIRLGKENLARDSRFQQIPEHVFQNRAMSLLDRSGIIYDVTRKKIAMPRSVFEKLDRVEQNIITQRLKTIVEILEPWQVNPKLKKPA